MYMISFDGYNNIQIANKFLRGKCYRPVEYGGKFVGLMEVVIPYGQAGYVCSNKKEGLVDFSYIPEEQLELAITILESLGVKGIITIQYDNESDLLCEEYVNFFCAMEIGQKEIDIRFYQSTIKKNGLIFDHMFDANKKEAMRTAMLDGAMPGVESLDLIDCETGEVLCQLRDGLITYVSGVGNPFKGKAFYEQ